MSAGEDDISMWQKLVIGEVTQEQFNQWLRECDTPFLELDKSIKDYGLERTLKLKFKLLSDIKDAEFNKLLKYYKEHHNLLVGYISRASINEVKNPNENN